MDIAANTLRLIRNAVRGLPLLFAGWVCAGNAGQLPKSDTQAWSELDLIHHITPSFTATLIGTLRMGEGLPNPTLYGGGMQLDYSLAPLTFAAGELVVRTRGASTGKAQQVQLPFVALTCSSKILGASVSDRNRLEQVDGVLGNPTRYRNRFQIDVPVTGTGLVSHIFLSDEAFYNFRESRWARNRGQVGFGVCLASSVELQIYCMRQSDRLSRIRVLNVVGTTLKISI